ncbi:flagellar hook-associated protein FlgL [Ramlibacter sp. G-1-2-2]|uniref:Flagellar hook-associated protein FlgL n=1 Tax=Ramlibacter agri TaxID=2728837 RepID=A0A848H487_9BURK|nr:flagellar hook-associated protein FlgL [Ramlibacter agri]NML43443.1 flagellar hook-associated protein FlgL [Ramlibacter agri]
MRVPTLQTSRASLQVLQQREAEQAKLQTQISSGVRVQTPGDDPVAAAQAELARSRLAHIAQDQRATQLSTSTLQAADGALSQGVDELQSAREALVAAGNGSYTASDRQALAQQLRATRDQLLAVANTSDGAGGYVFGGQGVTSAPFSADGSGYTAAAGTQRVGEAGRFASTVDGRAAFLALPQGNGVFTTASASANTGSGWISSGSVSDATQLTGHSYAVTVAGSAGAQTYSVTDTTSGATVASAQPFTAGADIEVQGQRFAISGTPAAGDSFTLAPAGQQSVFSTLDDAISLLEDNSVTSSAYNERLQRVQSGVDRALDGMQLARSRTAEEMRVVDGATATGQQGQIDASGRLKDLTELDMAQGISQMQNGQTAYEAALRSYAALGKTSLFDLIS